MNLSHASIAAAAQSQPLSQPQWADYYRAVAGRPPRKTLIMALNRYADDALLGPTAEARFAVDLGCGDGRDTVELLRRNWIVLAIDGEPDAIARLQQRQGIHNHTDLTTQVQRFEALTLPRRVDLINASFCLPFCLPDHFSALWTNIVAALRPGGRFCGHLFGDRDSWAAYPDRSHHTRSQIEQLLAPFEIEHLREDESPGITPLGEEKQWHIYHIVARRLNTDS